MIFAAILSSPDHQSALITAAVTGQIDVDSYGKSGTPSATLDRIEEDMQG